MNAWDEVIVTLQNGRQGSCTCNNFQNNCRPCPYAWAFLDDLRRDGLPYFASFYTRAEWIATYRIPLPPVLFSTLTCDPTVLPPKIKVQLGRREVKRKEAGTRRPSQRQGPEAVGGTKRKRGSAAGPQASAQANAPPAIDAAPLKRGTGVWGGRWEYIVETVTSESVTAGSRRPRRTAM